ncbi:transposase [Enterobacter cloacae complex sp. 2DZ2F20B]|uniref:transposase n=1 Tax=Enterobacter cloacae complex sp. 2DZ2F20B TaxID=2511993 RepID=UPI00101278A1|nr:hypothetical protein DD592_26765 [Enterobacter cloacae complex sp. 2DZ2F20B]
MSYIPNRSAATLMDHIRRVIRPDSEIWTDELRSYRLLRILGGASSFVHQTVNHSRFFQDRTTGVCTNQVEG